MKGNQTETHVARSCKLEHKRAPLKRKALDFTLNSKDGALGVFSD